MNSYQISMNMVMNIMMKKDHHFILVMVKGHINNRLQMDIQIAINLMVFQIFNQFFYKKIKLIKIMM